MNLSHTSIPLLNRLKDNEDQNAWDQFYEMYADIIFSFCRKRGCNESLCQDVLQETMVQLFRYIEHFSYDSRKGRFRSYLLRIVLSRIQILTKKMIKEVPMATMEDGAEIDMSDPNTEQPWEISDKLSKNKLIEEGLERVKKKVEPHTWNSFEKYVLGDFSADEVARLLKIKKNAVYQHKKRVSQLLEREVQQMQSEKRSCTR